MPFSSRTLPVAAFAYAALIVAPAHHASPALAANAAALAGSVRDAQTGLPLPGVSIALVGTHSVATSDVRGAFSIDGLEPGSYVLRLQREGYVPSDSDAVRIDAGGVTHVTLALRRTAAMDRGSLKTIGSTTVKATTALQHAATIYETLDTNELAETGTYRAADALRTLPGLNNGLTGDSAALGDDVFLSIRGIGTLETVATIDGHPIGYGFPYGGFNFQVSPIMGIRAIDVTYGSGGSNALGVSAIGGVVDFQTINPTRDQRVTVQQGYGTFDKAVSSLQATGTLGKRWGYAAELGVSSLDGPLKNAYFPQPGAAFDPSAPPGSSAYPIYKDDSAAVGRTSLFKLRYELTPSSRLTFTNLNSSYWEDKTGNGDGDYTTYNAALAFGNNDLKGKLPSDPCPSGEFQPLNQFGVPYGTGPNGRPDGGVPCESPQQYARFNTGFDGAGPAWESLNLNDEHLAYDASAGPNTIRVDAYTNRYFNTVDRTFQLPYEHVPGDQGLWVNFNTTEAGALIHDDFALSPSDTFGAGYSYLNTAYKDQYDGGPFGNPVIHDTALLLDEVYRAPGSPLALYANANLGASSATHTSFLDPRLSLVYNLTRNDIVRGAVGATTTQPSGDEIDVPFGEYPLGESGGGAPISCNGINSIGSAPSSLLKPERGVDDEFSYGHAFGGDSHLQLALYQVNVYSKLYSTQIPLSQSGTKFIDPTYLGEQEQKLLAACPGANPLASLGVTGTVNVGQLRARGFTLSGRQRLERQTSLDYVWDLDSTVLVAAPVALLENDRTLILGSQLPRLPLHTLQLALDHTFGRVFEARVTYHGVSANNTKALPAYSFTNFTAAAPLGRGTFSVTIDNLFDQYADIRGLRYEGVPLALNQYATAADYAPYTGSNATERYGLPYRRVFFNYICRVR